MTDRIRLDGKVAVVTGAAGIIGSATMLRLAERGARTVTVDRREDDLQTAIRNLPASAEALAVTADVTSEDEVKAYVRSAIDRPRMTRWWSAFRRAGSDRPRRLLPSWRSSPPTRRVMFRGRPIPSTAAGPPVSDCHSGATRSVEPGIQRLPRRDSGSALTRIPE